MTHAAQLRINRKPAAWLVAGGILAAIAMSVSCLTILIH